MGRTKNMIVILKIKYTEEIRSSIEWMKGKCQEYPTENRININKKKNCVIEEGKTKRNLDNQFQKSNTRNQEFQKRQKVKLRGNTRKFPKMRRHRHHNSKSPLRAQFSKSQRTPQHITQLPKNEEEIPRPLERQVVYKGSVI